MAETFGSLVDKICIAELKIFHTRERVERPDATAELKALCENRLKVLDEQRTDLVNELNALKRAWAEGKYKPKVYRQFKMYNDPRFQTKK